MTAHSAIIMGRQAAERMMTDTCRIVRVVDGVDGEGFDVQSEIGVYEGACKVQTYEAYEMVHDSAGAVVYEQRYQVHLPWRVNVVEVGDIVTVDDRPGRLRIVGLFDKTHATARRFYCEEVANE